MANVTIYEHINYQGTSQELGVGSYDLDALSIGNDRLSSLRIPTGMKVTLYEHIGFQGRMKVLVQDTSFVSDEFNDITSSIKVESESNAPVSLLEQEPIRLCGTIFRFNENPGDFRTALDDQIRIRTDAFEINFLLATTPEAEAVLDSIRAPHDRFYGCVYGQQLPEQGFEGLVFNIDRIELIREQLV
ncbi:MAG: hypothetical protein Kow00121_54640 [Elainellaceae cyanobacterium]